MNYNLKKMLALLFLMSNCYFVIAQKVNLSNFFLIPDNKQVLIYWTIDSGPTCNGITIWRSTDSLSYQEVGNIAGICGSSSSAIPYNFTDKNPIINKTNYYKIRLGNNQFSEIKFVILKYIEPGKIIIKPNPASENFNIEFNNDNNGSYTLTFVNSVGKIVFEKNDIRESVFTLNTAEFESGTYFLILTGSEGRAIKNSLVIVK